MLEKAPSQCSFLMQLQKLLALDDTKLPICAVHNSILPAKPISGPEQCRLSDIHYSNLKSGGRLMDTPAEFRKYAANCKKMSKLSEDPETIALWRRMEERWLLCAKLAEEDEQAATRLQARRTTSKRHINGLSHRL
jgi:hypothetical protein